MEPVATSQTCITCWLLENTDRPSGA